MYLFLDGNNHDANKRDECTQTEEMKIANVKCQTDETQTVNMECQTVHTTQNGIKFSLI